MKKTVSLLALGGLLAGGALLSTPTAALAAPVTWTVPPTVMPDGATVSGTFVYDTATATISNVNITQTVLRPGTYTFNANFPAPYRGGQRTASAAVGDETWWINTTGIPANGGAYNAAAIGTGNCISEVAGVCNNAFIGNSQANVPITGVLVSTVPTLSEWAMILFGLLLAGGASVYIQRRRITA